MALRVEARVTVFNLISIARHEAIPPPSVQSPHFFPQTNKLILTKPGGLQHARDTARSMVQWSNDLAIGAAKEDDLE